MKDRTIVSIREMIETVLYADSRITLTEDQKMKLERILIEERGLSLSSKMIEKFIMGNDYGHIPDILRKDYPKLDEFLDALF